MLHLYFIYIKTILFYLIWDTLNLGFLKEWIQNLYNATIEVISNVIYVIMSMWHVYSCNICSNCFKTKLDNIVNLRAIHVQSYIIIFEQKFESVKVILIPASCR